MWDFIPCLDFINFVNNENKVYVKNLKNHNRLLFLLWFLIYSQKKGFLYKYDG